jgi:glycosyltransferase involved in cell wall biosynthesis
MATFNGARFIEQQLDSILSQLKETDELIISDDGSVDATIEIVKRYKDPRIRLFHFGGGNLIYNFENALKHASGEIIFLSDQDDIWFPDKVEKSVKALQSCGLVFSNAAMFHGDKEDHTLFFTDKIKKTGLISNLWKVKFLGATLAFKKAVLEKALPFPRGLAMHDIWIGLIAEATSSTCYLDEPLIYYRRHGNTASTTGSKSSNSIKRKLLIRLHLAVHLFNRILSHSKINN